MQHFEYYEKYSQNEAVELLISKSPDEIEAFFEHLDEAFMGISIEDIGNAVFGGKLSEMSTEEIIVKSGQIAALITSFLGPVGNTISVGVEVVLMLYWGWKYSQATSEQERSVAVSELMAGLMIVGINALMIPGGRLLGRAMPKLFRFFGKGKLITKSDDLLNFFSKEQVKLISKHSDKLLKATTKVDDTLSGGFKFLSKFLPKKFVAKLSNGWKKISDGLKSIFKKNTDDVAETAIKGRHSNALNKIKKVNKAVDPKSLEKLNGIAKKYGVSLNNKKYTQFLEDLALDKNTGGLNAINKAINKADDYVIKGMNKPGDLVNSNVLKGNIKLSKMSKDPMDKMLSSPEFLTNFRILSNGKRMPVGEFILDIQKQLTKYPSKFLKYENQNIGIIVGGKAAKTKIGSLGELSKSGLKLGFGMAKLPAKLFMIGLKILTYTNRQFVYVIDEFQSQFTKSSIIDASKGVFDLMPVIGESGDFLKQNPEFIILTYDQPSVKKFYRMDWQKTQDPQDAIEEGVEITPEIIGLRQDIEEIKRTPPFNEYKFVEPSIKKDETLNYYTIVATNSYPELKNVNTLIVITKADGSSRIYPMLYDTNKKKAETVHWKELPENSDITNVMIIQNPKDASTLTQEYLNITKNTLKEYEEDKFGSQKAMVSIFKSTGLIKRMEQGEKDRRSKLYIKDKKDVERHKDVVQRRKQKEAA
jgi:hypothetical protein